MGSKLNDSVTIASFVRKRLRNYRKKLIRKTKKTETQVKGNANFIMTYLR